MAIALKLRGTITVPLRVPVKEHSCRLRHLNLMFQTNTLKI
jgi:hypothetical protein